MRLEQVLVVVLIMARGWRLSSASRSTRQLGRPINRLVATEEQQTIVEPLRPGSPVDRAGQPRLDKRSWTPRASRPSQEMVELLLEELSSLDLDGGKPPAQTHPTRQAQQFQQQFVHDQQPANFLFNGRLRGRSASEATGSGQQSSVSSEEGVVGSAYSRQQGGASTNQLAPGNYPKRRNSNRHMPCFFNAITCF